FEFESDEIVGPRNRASLREDQRIELRHSAMLICAAVSGILRGRERVAAPRLEIREAYVLTSFAAGLDAKRGAYHRWWFDGALISVAGASFVHGEQQWIADDTTFAGCNFDSTTISTSRFPNVTFEHTQFMTTSISNSTFANSRWTSSHFLGDVMNGITFDDASFRNCRLNSVSFHSCTFRNSSDHDNDRAWQSVTIANCQFRA